MYDENVHIQSVNPVANKGKYIIAHHETCLSEGSEGELHTCTDVCEKNPGHTEFIPVDAFALKHISRGQRDNELYEFIKATADLTVKISVYVTSANRPEFWPGTDEEYPFYIMIEQKALRKGSGIISGVYRFIDGINQYEGAHLKKLTKCWCRHCELSDSHSNLWWEFDVITATHVVFDEVEANHTTLRLFYDTKDSPLVLVDKVTVDYVNIEYDRSKLKVVTCDPNVGEKVETSCENHIDAWRKVDGKYKKVRSEERFTFIVSHPHGCTKQVSVGQWIDKYSMAEDEIKFSYTACTCPGSSGARVYCFGDKNLEWRSLFYPGHVHSGTKDNYNYSGVERC